MEQIEEDARKRHGDSLYDLTWRARNEQNLSKKNLLWTLLALQVSMFYVVVVIIWYVGYLVNNQIIGISGWVWLISATATAAFIEGYLSPKRSISNASSFYSIAADMKRTGQQGVFPRLLFLFSGIMSVLLAMLVMTFASRRLHLFSSTDLDVLGSILSKAGRWNMAKNIYQEIQLKYAGRLDKNSDTQYQLSVSFGLACKWMMSSPAFDGNKQRISDTLYKSMIMDVVREYPEMSPEVAMRFREALGPRMDEAMSPIKDARFE